MRPEKESMVEEVHKQVESARAIVVASYMGLKAQELEQFRNGLKSLSSDCMVVKNTLLSRVLAKASLPNLDAHLVGPTAIIFGKGDDIAFAKRLAEFSKDHDSLKIKVGILEQNIISKEQLAALALLPGREVLIAMAIGLLKSPMSGLVGVLSAVQRGFVVALAAIKDKKEAAEKASAALAAPMPAEAAQAESTPTESASPKESGETTA